jgi:dTDP-4-dehydrorhamnose 3,5-epimerase
LDDRGYLYEMLRADDPFFQAFGQAYISSINPGTVKGFHKHYKQTDHVVCVSGQIKLVLVEDWDGKVVGEPTIEEHHLSILNPKMVVIPPGVWHGWMCIGEEPALVVNFSTHAYNPDDPDEERVDPHWNPWSYTWQVVDK